MPLSVGYAQSLITPSLSRPVYMAGFDRGRLAQSIHDDLFARALALSWVNPSGFSQQLVLVSLDLIGLGRSICLDLARGLTDSSLIIASTHTHHGPDTIGLWGPDLSASGCDPAYLEQLQAAILAAARQALGSLQPAIFRAVSVHVPGLVKNARDPHILDDELSLIQFLRPAESPPAARCAPLATLAVFPCHPETLSRENPHITADYPHALLETIKQVTGGPGIFFSGALGGMMTPNVVDHTFAEADRIGRSLALAGLEALESSPTVDPAGFTFAQRLFNIPLKSPLLEQALQAGLIRGSILENGQIQTETSLLQIGPAWAAFVPGELLPKLGLDLKHRLLHAGAQIPIVIGLANDELGYIIPDEDYAYPANPFDPGAHYEETMSVGPNAGSILLANLDALIQDASASRQVGVNS